MRRPTRRRLWPATEFAVAAAVVLILVTSLFAYRRLPSSPSDDERSLPAAATPTALEELFATCPMPIGTQIPGAADYFTEWGLGQSPVWLLGWSNPPEALREQHAAVLRRYVGPNFVQTPYGWGMKALWVIEGGWTEPVTLHGSRLDDGLPVRFNVGSPADEPTTSVVLDPRHPGIPVQHGTWREWPSSLTFPETGCYELVATWADGSWRLRIPVVVPELIPIRANVGDCPFEPMPMDEGLALAATPVTGTPSAGILTTAPVMTGDPASLTTFAAVRTTIKLVYACLASDDPSRAYRLFTDDALRAFQRQGIIRPEEVVGRFGPREAFLIQEVRNVPDYKVAAVIEFHGPLGAFTETWIFARGSTSYHVDAVVVSPPDETTPQP